MTDPNIGLSSHQVAQLTRAGKVNRDPKAKSNSYASIIRRNVFTFFNLINVILATLILMTGVSFASLRNVLFLGVAVCNSLIGIIQEVRAKIATDRLKVVTQSNITVVRDGTEQTVKSQKIVLGDIIILSAGGQVPADCEVLTGSCVADESLLTGEADGVAKQVGDTLLSGSYIISGSCRVRTIAVGINSYGHKLANEARLIRRKKSDIVHTINVILGVMSIIIVPLGTGLFLSQYLKGAGFIDSVFSTGAAVIGMLPEGMMLLTSSVFALATVMLAKRRVLSQDLHSSEALARTDVLCLDKTGTLTEGVLEVANVVPISDEYSEWMLIDFALASADINPTALAIKSHFGNKEGQNNCSEFLPFDSFKKLSAATFDNGVTLVLGAPDFVAPEIDDTLRDKIEELSCSARVIMLAKSESLDKLKNAEPLALILLRDKIRPQAKKTMQYFAEQGVSVRVISGDHPATAGDVAHRVGIESWDKQIDMSKISDDEIDSVVADNIVFGRVSPSQKQLIIKALQKHGHTVTMTGDGVNDVLALKEADCSVAPATATDIARDAAKLVLLDSDFDSLPEVVRQGRRSIKNLKRSVSLFLIKIVYSFVLSITFLALPIPYPFEPIHLTLITFVGVAAPGFLLSLEPNYERTEGQFIFDIISRSLPAGTAIASGVVLAALISDPLGLSLPQYATVCVLSSGIAILINLLRVCLPLNWYRGSLFAVMCALFCVGAFIFNWAFSLTGLPSAGYLALSACVACDALVYFCVMSLSAIIIKRRKAK